MKELKTEIAERFITDEMESVTITWSLEPTDNETYLRRQIEATKTLIKFKRDRRTIMNQAHKKKMDMLSDDIIDEIEKLEKYRTKLYNETHKEDFK